jgi:hypothetical protein
MNRTIGHACAASVRAGVIALGLSCAAPAAFADEAQAKEILKAMTDYLAAQQTISFDVDSSLEIVTTDDQKLTIASSGSLYLQRPDKLRFERKGGFATIDVAYDGKTLTVLNREAKVLGQEELAGTVDALIETLRDTHQRPLPAADLMVADPGAVLAAEITNVRDLGSGFIHGQECDHLAFRNESTDWQIWVAQGDVPHPCRLVITSKDITGWPTYTLDFSAWGSGTAKPEFTLAAPEGATAVAITDVPDLDEVAGIYAAKEN